ncbi:hypothetical protein QTN47_11540 [Danxiaibacter flavus]|uniref:Uncharacterized protein n=1 Tax=Danxiaibacter flavus TaxID=3049108 RepID=A0ABV3ZE48_9BACT|nr:hypothetical protein QNM32_11545 [Chitinophagaceae bacterium DXS]
MNKFTIFFSSGGGDQLKIVDSYWKKISQIFDKLSKKEYSSEIENFHIALRVDGEFISFGDPEGCSNLRYLKTKKTIANTISFGKKILKNEGILKKFMAENLVKAFEQMTGKLLREKINIEKDDLMNDLKTLIDKEL